MSVPRNLPQQQSKATPSATLWSDAEGAICPPFPIYRHPVFRLLRPVCYGLMPLMLVAALFSGHFRIAGQLVVLDLLFVGLVLAVMALSTQHGKLVGAARTVRARSSGWRFLCPSCLRFGPVRFACGACGGEVEAFVLDTRGCYLNDCPHCHEEVFPRFFYRGNPTGARCDHCGDATDPLFHCRRVRVVAVLDAASLRALAAVGRFSQTSGREGEHLCWDDGETLTYVINVSEPRAGEEPFPTGHAAPHPDPLWLRQPWSAVHACGQARDRFIRRAGLTEAGRRAQPVALRTGDWDPVTRRLLESRFPNLRDDAEPTELLKAR